MATLKAKEIRDKKPQEREKKLKELKLELIKSKANAQKSGSTKAKEIKKIIARILTINTSEKKKANKPKELKNK